MKNRRKRLKTKIYIRDSINPFFSKMILIYPDGKAYASQDDEYWIDDPCYGVGKNRRETIERMKAYEERHSLEFKSELIGEI